MRRLPLLLTLVVGVALWAIPTQAQVADFFARYVADGTDPGENNNALDNGYELCPPHASEGCTHYSQAHHHIVQGGGTYATDVLDVHNCSFVTVCASTDETNGSNPEFYVQRVLNNDGDGATNILADFNGDGVVDANDDYALDGDDGTDSDGDGTALQLSCLYDITGVNKIRLNITDDDGDAAGDDEDTYAEVSCR